MNKAEMIAAIEAGKITRELKENLIDFYYDFDPYGIIEEYGHIDDPGTRDKVLRDINYLLNNDRKIILSDLEA